MASDLVWFESSLFTWTPRIKNNILERKCRGGVGSDWPEFP